VNGPVEAAFQRIQRDCAATAARMQCPRHQRAARVEVADDDLEALQIEVFTCCEESRQRVRDALQERLAGVAQPFPCDPV